MSITEKFDSLSARGSSSSFRIVGKPVPVKDALEKVTGRLAYGVDLAMPGMLHGRILRSPHAHARIAAIDTAAAESFPGVVGVVTHEDAPPGIWENAWFNRRGRILDGTARFVGDEVAAVAATTVEAADEALGLIEVEWDVLPAVLDVAEAMEPQAPQIREEGNVRPPYTVAWGDVAAGEAQSDVVVRCDVTYESQQMASVGRNACLARWDGDRVTVWTSSQTPSELRDGIHEAFQIPLSKIRVCAVPTGSSFGIWWSSNFMLVTVMLSLKTGRPVLIELDNYECIATVKRRHSERTQGAMGASRDGRVTFARFDHVIDNGAYGFKDDVGFFCVDNWGLAPHGRYTITGVNTNTLTAGCMRGVGDVTLGAAVERLADKLAIELDLDPVEFRLMNQIRAGDELRFKHASPYMKGSVDEYVRSLPESQRDEWPTPFRLSSGSTAEILRQGAEAFDWKGRWKGWGAPVSEEGPVRRGVGVATGIHVCGVEFEGATSAVVRINPDGSLKVHASCGRQGQGSETTLAQVAAEEVGIPFEAVEIETGDTDSCPWSHGSLASNTMYRIGWAVRSAATDARRQLLELAAREAFECDPADLDIDEGVIHRVGQSTGPGVPIGELMFRIRTDALGQLYSITGVSNTTMPPASTFARHFSAHFAEVAVDIETGEIRLTDYLACQDSGTVMNPQVLKNQVIGGAICGAGFALCEQLVFDEDTGAVLNGNFLDYRLLRTTDFPWTARVLFGDSYDPVGPFGARGAGEAPIAAAGPAISQAVYNALGGVWVDMPMTPERVLKALGRIA
ncbi:MAG: xanthine dehydrogenase family protein molybdopterin-binding subunit [Thermomicrobiales bacterium]|nr:xanthine dehydrogenase family protein molybdopterin-binding subunit [Thermomicrobiales bacterium]